MGKFSSIENVINAISNLLKFNKTPVKPLPLPLILTGVPRRSGLSAIDTANRIIARKPEANLPVGPLPNGEINPDELMIRIIVEEVFRELQENGVVSIGIPPGITLTATGANGGGPVQVVGATTKPQRGYGTIQ